MRKRKNSTDWLAHEKNLLQNLLCNLLRIYSLPPWRNMIFPPADAADFRKSFLNRRLRGLHGFLINYRLDGFLQIEFQMRILR